MRKGMDKGGKMQERGTRLPAGVNTHESIWKIFGKYFDEKVKWSNDALFFYHLITASALPGVLLWNSVNKMPHIYFGPKMPPLLGCWKRH